MKAAGLFITFILVSVNSFGQFKYYEQGIDAYQAKGFTNVDVKYLRRDVNCNRWSVCPHFDWRHDSSQHNA